jgi:formate/nitrite transporter FocA (FNT family)
MSDNEGGSGSQGERLPAKTVYEVIQREGEKEMRRPASSLWWSGVIAGLAISSSVLAQAALHLNLPDTPWRWPIENLGYTVGFILVILGRLQLFTENTITPVLPIMANFSMRAFRKMIALWAIVFAANLVGTFLAAVVSDLVGIVTDDQLGAMREIARKAVLGKTPMEALLLGIPAGFFVAAIVWMLPNAKGAELWIIIIMTYLIAIGGFAHVVVGSMETFLLMVNGEIGVLSGAGGYILPALIGNILGGTALFSLLAYAQVREEIS